MRVKKTSKKNYLMFNLANAFEKPFIVDTITSRVKELLKGKRF
jgi:hypothetical protein